MNWGDLFSLGMLKLLALPAAIGVLVIVATIVLRHFLYKLIHKIASKTTTIFDDIIIRETRIASLLWCIWIGIFVGYKIANTPLEWVELETTIISILFVALGFYTLIAIILGILKWYRDEICPQTTSNLDNVIVTSLIITVPIIIIALGIIVILKMMGVENEAVDKWIAEHLVSLSILSAVSITLVLITMIIVPKFMHNLIRKANTQESDDEVKRRSDTLISVVVTGLQVLILFVFIVMVLTEFNQNPAAIITGAGVAGVALGFGAQSLVKDLIAGWFVIVENQYRKGDVVKIADTSGVVEEINLRRTVLRDMDGIIHVVPNGEIRVASNYTKLLSRVNLNIPYDTDLEKAMNVINRIGKEMADDPAWKPYIISPPKALRIEKLGDSGIDIKVVGDTKPMKQWDIMGELRLRLKKAFDKEGIEIPWPHTKVYFGNQPPKELLQNTKQPKE
jgi:small-conductance mechanosensitive channel